MATSAATKPSDRTSDDAVLALCAPVAAVAENEPYAGYSRDGDPPPAALAWSWIVATGEFRPPGSLPPPLGRANSLAELLGGIAGSIGGSGGVLSQPAWGRWGVDGLLVVAEPAGYGVIIGFVWLLVTPPTEPDFEFADVAVADPVWPAPECAELELDEVWLPEFAA